MNNVAIRIALTGLAISAIVSPVSPALASWNLAGLAYEDSSYRGSYFPILSGARIPDLNRYDFNDKISSIQVAPAPGCTITAYIDANYRNSSRGFTSSSPTVPTVQNDKYSSLQASVCNHDKDAWKVAALVYENENFTGRVLPIFKNGTIANLADYGFNDKITSIQIAPNCIVLTYLNANFNSSTVLPYRGPVNVPNVGEAYNDKISSINVQCRS
jgi:hypothetical protein